MTTEHGNNKKGADGALFCRLILDPHDAPVESIAGEPPLAPEKFAAEWLRTRFANPPAWQPEINNEHLLRRHATLPMPAAVLMPIVMHEHGPTLLMTRRNAHLTDHAGQISFPGGRVENTDASIIETALRETEEEIGLARRHVEVLGALPDYFTATGYRVTPIVAIVQPPVDLRADPSEVDEIFEVPFSFLMDGSNHQRRIVDFPEGSRRTFYAMSYDRFFIWGATAGMLRNLFHFLRA